ncbi:hypothetical protein CDN99_07760 [Roseateles aquatilis]|uniref:Uncharacterized protein n=1 Tax=Roseateles aquatilis TaxID=431061 RepID=A0A246JI52_9BURK|nr:hypothetical protein CDN99_07760 [Roseateles aquatilis]
MLAAGIGLLAYWRHRDVTTSASLG